MNNREIIKERTISESSYGDDETKLAEVIALYPDTESGVTEHHKNTIHYQPYSDRRDKIEQHRIRRDFRDKISFDQVRKKAEDEIINFTFNSIVDALDYDIDRIERSNLFDEWKDALRTILTEVTSLSTNHRKILGAVIIATKGKDVTDFKIEELNLLRDATYMLRQLRVSRNDSKRIIKRLIDIDDNMAIPLSVNDISDNEEKRLDQLMKSIIERSKLV